MNIQTVTITVSNIQQSKEFYEKVLGFTPGEYYAPINWQSYRVDDQLFAIREMPGFKRGESFDIVNFEVDDIETLWKVLQTQVTVIEKLAPTPWGSYRFVIADPDGYHLAFVAHSVRSELRAKAYNNIVERLENDKATTEHPAFKALVKDLEEGKKEEN